MGYFPSLILWFNPTIFDLMSQIFYAFLVVFKTESVRKKSSLLSIYDLRFNFVKIKFKEIFEI